MDKLRDAVGCLLLALHLADGEEGREDTDYVRGYWREIRKAEHHCDAPITCDACVRDEFLKKANKFIEDLYADQ
jgi:hypothetical protein